MKKFHAVYFSVFKTPLASLFSLAALALLLNFTQARAADYIWNGAVSTDWNNAANWTPRGVPSASDSATVIGDKTVNTNVPVRVGRLILAAGSALQGAGDITVVSGATFTDVKLSGSGLLNIEPGAIVDLNSVGRNNGVISNLLGTVVNTVLNLLISKRVVNRGLIRWNAGNLQLGADMTNEGGFDVRGSGSLSQSGLLRTTFTNNGIFSKSGIGAMVWSPAFKNKGTMHLTGGTLDLRGDSSQIAGLTKLEGGSLKSANPFLLQGGKWGGSGDFTGTLRNEGGVLAPGFSPGAIVINGGYVQAPNGILRMEIGGLNAGTQYDQLIVNGSATLNGTLEISQYGNFEPAAGNSFQLVKYLSSSGSFSAIKTAFPSGRYFTITKTSSYLVVQTNADAGLPCVTVSSPKLNQAGSSVPTASGTASDALSGVASVSVRLYRYATAGITAGFWNGATWDAVYNATTHERPATCTVNWSWSLPALADGKYYLIATVKDKANNTASTATITFWVDTIIPATATITSPSHNSTVTNLNTVTGTATDNGSGISSLMLQIKKLANNTYWNGSGWATAPTDLATQRSGNTWSRAHSSTFPMPSASMLAAGTYQIKATATDGVGLKKSITHTVSVTASTTKALSRSLTTLQEASPLTVSMGEARDNKVLLYCSMAPASARPEQFLVLVNNSQIQVSNAVISGMALTLHLNDAIESGQTVMVSWRLFDEVGRKATGLTVVNSY
ncbi:MAG TPA: Ig-like domain-containing protein [Abditibacteriaceae bacterium]|jgi:hypothetical protein